MGHEKVVALHEKRVFWSEALKKIPPTMLATRPFLVFHSLHPDSTHWSRGLFSGVLCRISWRFACRLRLQAPPLANLGLFVCSIGLTPLVGGLSRKTSEHAENFRCDGRTDIFPAKGSTKIKDGVGLPQISFLHQFVISPKPHLPISSHFLNFFS